VPALAAAALIGGALLVAGCGGAHTTVAPSSGAAASPAEATQLHGLVPKPLPRRPNFTLTETSGRPFSFAARTRGKLTYLFFGYTHCPDVCPTTMGDIAYALHLQRPGVRRGIDVVFVTVDPRRDTRRVLRAWADSDPPWDVVLPVARGHAQPLAAAYRPVLAPLAAKLVAADRLRPAFLFDECSVLRLDDDALLSDPQLQAADPHLDSVVNLNGPDDYTEAHARPVPQVTVECFGVLATNHGRGQRAVRAATVAGAAEAAGVTWDRHVLAAVNGDQTGRDGDLALVAGDTVAFLSAAAGG